MSITDFLFSLHKLLAWLLSLLTLLLPQHLLAPSQTDPPATVQAAPQLCAKTTTPPRKLDRVAWPSTDADEARTAVSASENHDAAVPAARTKR